MSIALLTWLFAPVLDAVVLNLFRGKRLDYEGKNSGWLKFVPYKVQALISILLAVGCYVWLVYLGY